jgi:hypothetical protein
MAINYIPADVQNGLIFQEPQDLPQLPDGKIVAYDGQDILPTLVGYKSFFGIQDQLGSVALPATEVQESFVYSTEQNQLILIALCGDGLWLRTLEGEGTFGIVDTASEVTVTFPTGLGSWTKIISPSIAIVNPWKLWTKVILKNKLYLYVNGLSYIVRLSSPSVGTLVLEKLEPTYIISDVAKQWKYQVSLDLVLGNSSYKQVSIDGSIHTFYASREVDIEDFVKKVRNGLAGAGAATITGSAFSRTLGKWKYTDTAGAIGDIANPVVSIKDLGGNAVTDCFASISLGDIAPSKLFDHVNRTLTPEAKAYAQTIRDFAAPATGVLNVVSKFDTVTWNNATAHLPTFKMFNGNTWTATAWVSSPYTTALDASFRTFVNNNLPADIAAIGVTMGADFKFGTYSLCHTSGTLSATNLSLNDWAKVYYFYANWYNYHRVSNHYGMSDAILTPTNGVYQPPWSGILDTSYSTEFTRALYNVHTVGRPTSPIQTTPVNPSTPVISLIDPSHPFWVSSPVFSIGYYSYELSAGKLRVTKTSTNAGIGSGEVDFTNSLDLAKVIHAPAYRFRVSGASADVAKLVLSYTQGTLTLTVWEPNTDRTFYTKAYNNTLIGFNPLNPVMIVSSTNPNDTAVSIGTAPNYADWGCRLPLLMQTYGATHTYRPFYSHPVAPTSPIISPVESMRAVPAYGMASTTKTKIVVDLFAVLAMLGARTVFTDSANNPSPVGSWVEYDLVEIVESLDVAASISLESYRHPNTPAASFNLSYNEPAPSNLPVSIDVPIPASLTTSSQVASRIFNGLYTKFPTVVQTQVAAPTAQITGTIDVQRLTFDGHTPVATITKDGTETGDAITLISSANQKMAEVDGIFKARGRLGAWKASGAIHWSALNNPVDFLPSLSTQANEITVEATRGKILQVLGSGDIFTLFNTGNLVQASFTGDQNIFAFREIHPFGVADPRHIGQTGGTQLIYTKLGMLQNTGGQIQPIDAVFLDYINQNKVPLKIGMLGARYLTIEITEEYLDNLFYDRLVRSGAQLTYPAVQNYQVGQEIISIKAKDLGLGLDSTYQKTYLYDIVLQKWGVCSASHKTLIDFNPWNEDSQVISTGDSTYKLKFGALLPSGQVALFDDSNPNSYILYGRWGLSRRGRTRMTQVDVGFSKLPKARVIVEPALDNGRIDFASKYIGQEITTSTKETIRLTSEAKWFNVLVSGQFDLNYLNVGGFVYGRY